MIPAGNKTAKVLRVQLHRNWNIDRSTTINGTERCSVSLPPCVCRPDADADAKVARRQTPWALCRHTPVGVPIWNTTAEIVAFALCYFVSLLVR